MNANLGEAFSLTPPIPKAGRRNRYGGGEENDDSDDDEMEHVNGVIANEERLRRCVKDFWHIVGWAFNCSVVHPKRWKYWKVWLDYMLDVLYADWDQRDSQDDEAFRAKIREDPATQCEFTNLRGSLVIKYLADVKGRVSAVRRVVGAIFTDGGADDLRNYPKVFQNEIQEVRTQKGQKRKREDEFNNETRGFGDDALDDQPLSSFQINDATPPPSQSTDNGEAAPDPYMGGPESIVLRLRVLALVSISCTLYHDHFTDCPSSPESRQPCRIALLA